MKTHRLVSILLSLSLSFAFIAENLCVEEFELWNKKNTLHNYWCEIISSNNKNL